LRTRYAVRPFFYRRRGRLLESHLPIPYVVRRCGRLSPAERGSNAGGMTNQSAGRDCFAESLVREVHERLIWELAREGAGVTRCIIARTFRRMPALAASPRSVWRSRPELACGSIWAASSWWGPLGRGWNSPSEPCDEDFFVPAGHAEDELAWHAKTWPRQPDFVAADRSMAVKWIF